MKKVLFYSILALGISTLLVGCNNSKKAAEAEEAARLAQLDSLKKVEMEKMNEAEKQLAQLPEEPVFDIVTNMGTIKVKLYKKTPKHRDNFAKLAIAGYYDDILFHRVINGFMIQTGDPYTKDSTKVNLYGTGGPDYTVPAEFVPEYTHIKGALAAARRGDAANPKRESSGSQFYIVQDPETCAQLDGAYTVFGETLEGLDVVDAIADVPVNQRDCPLTQVKIITIRLDESCLPEKPAEETPAKEKPAE